VRHAVDRMHEEDVKKLPVVDSLEVVGIVTRSDVADHVSAVVREAHALDDQRDRWEARKADIDEF
jgi:CBS domain-containing protein